MSLTLIFKNDGTYIKKKYSENSTKEELLVEAFLKIIGCLVCEDCRSSFWVFSCRAKNANMVWKTKKVTLNFSSFNSPQQLSKELTQKFGHEIVIGGSIQRVELIQYFQTLKKEYTHPRIFVQTKIIGFMGNNYWILDKDTHLKNGVIIPEDDHEYISSENMTLTIEKCLFEEENCIMVNRRIMDELCCFGCNQSAAEFVFSFALSRLLQLSKVEEKLGESNILMLFGEKNVGKTFTQSLIHFGQGGVKENHDLFFGAGNSVTSGTTINSSQTISRKTAMLLNMNDLRNSNIQAEALLQLHESLQQGSAKSGMWRSNCCGVILSSNVVEPERIRGRVVRVDYNVTPFTPERDEQLQSLKRTCKNYKGFLLMWVIHFGEFRLTEKEKARVLLCKVFEKYIPNLQQRCCSSVALVIYTKICYFFTLGLEVSVVKEVEDAISKYKKNPEKSVFEKIEENVLRRLMDTTQPKTLLNWYTKATIKNSRKKEASLAIYCKSLNGFVDLQKNQLEEELDKVAENVLGGT